MKSYRNSGAIGAILDEYEKAIQELLDVIAPLSEEELILLIDKHTQDPDCVSIQAILSHVISAGYNYAIIMRKHFGETIEYQKTKKLDTIAQYQEELQKMFAYNVQLFEDYPDIQLEEVEKDNKIRVSWGQEYDTEQLFEHAIVHVLRHRRQIERFRIRIKEKNKQKT